MLECPMCGERGAERLYDRGKPLFCWACLERGNGWVRVAVPVKGARTTGRVKAEPARVAAAAR